MLGLDSSMDCKVFRGQDSLHLVGSGTPVPNRSRNMIQSQDMLNEFLAFHPITLIAYAVEIHFLEKALICG